MKIVETEDLCFSYEGYEVLHGITFSIEEGDFIGVVGPNGSGKSTLIRLILGLLKPDEGTVKVFGRSASEFKDWGKIGYVPQKYELDRSFPGSVEEILSLKTEKSTKIAKIMGIEGLMKRKFAELSAGQQQRVLIALSMASGPRLLILDEPTVGVDIKAQQEFYRLLRKINSELGVTILMVTHEVGVIPKYVKNVMCINRTLCCFGKAADTEKLLKNVYGDEIKIFEHE